MSHIQIINWLQTIYSYDSTEIETSSANPLYN